MPYFSIKDAHTNKNESWLEWFGHVLSRPSDAMGSSLRGVKKRNDNRKLSQNTNNLTESMQLREK